MSPERRRRTTIEATCRAFVALTVLAAPAAGRAAAAGTDAEAAKFFESSVRPVLAANCFKCHGPEKQKGGLRLDSRAAVLAGGTSGPAVVPGKPAESLLAEAVNYETLEMPPGGKLPDRERETLLRWVAMGAPWSSSAAEPAPVTAPAKKRRLTDADRSFWSFRPVVRPEVPSAAGIGWARNPIDGFIGVRLAAEGLSPAPEADRRTLIRRLSFDLRGLPPTPEEVEAFDADRRNDAYESLVDRMLASPQYGERWARHWLDLVRYAESDGYRQDAYRPDAWRYRDYVVKSLNKDKPYDRFVAEQLAGDEIDPLDPEHRVAVGFLRLGTYEFNQRDVPGQWATILNEITDVTGDVFLGLGVGCARCHDHKFDPILQRDYFRLQSFFAPIVLRDDLTLVSPDDQRRYEGDLATWEAKTERVRAEIAEVERPYLNKAAEGAFAKFPAEIQALLRKPAAERTPLEEQLARLAYRQVVEEEVRVGDIVKKSKDRAAWEALRKKLAALGPKPEAPPRAPSVTDIGAAAPPTLIPGDRSRREVEPGFLTLLDPGPARLIPSASAPQSTGRRSALAAWLTRPDNPLTTRVIVNRLWQYHFGRGLVATSSDFGRLGERPSHPELLDWLASEFVARGWSLKAMHRLMVTSATYRQASRHPSPDLARRKDPEGRLLWRMPTRRLDIEPIRDAMLAASGELDPTPGGPGGEASGRRRTIYTKVMRNTRDPLLDAFDAPDGSLTTPYRNATTTPIQALMLVNGPWTLARAKALASRLRSEATDDEVRVDRAYRLAFGRPSTSDERAEALTFLRAPADRSRPVVNAIAAGGAACDPLRDDATLDDPAALVDFCHALFNASEFLYVD